MPFFPANGLNRWAENPFRVDLEKPSTFKERILMSRVENIRNRLGVPDDVGLLFNPESLPQLPAGQDLSGFDAASLIPPNMRKSPLGPQFKSGFELVPPPDTRPLFQRLFGLGKPPTYSTLYDALHGGQFRM